MLVVLGETGAIAVRVSGQFVLDPTVDDVTAYAALRALAPDVDGQTLLDAIDAAT